MKNTYKKIFAWGVPVFILTLMTIPFFASAAWGGLVQCDGSVANPCDFNAFMKTLNFIITWIMEISVSIATIAFVYAGFLYLTSGANAGNRTKANTIAWNVIKGYVIILCAWLAIHTVITSIVNGPGAGDITRYFTQ